MSAALRVLLLTTQTTHHTFFVREMAAKGHCITTFLETTSLIAPYLTQHPFESQRDAYEREHFFSGKDIRIADICPTRSFASMNDAPCFKAIEDLRPDLTFVFGTQKLLPDTLRACGPQLFNLHGGDTSRYRGLDSHLWAIYDEEWHALITTLHRVSVKLDEGDIVLTKPVPVPKGCLLSQLRARNTEVCLDLALEATTSYQKNRKILSYPQTCPGRYFSHMPSDLKTICIQKFEAYAKRDRNEPIHA